jgi:hypothetical protein
MCGMKAHRYSLLLALMLSTVARGQTSQPATSLTINIAFEGMTDEDAIGQVVEANYKPDPNQKTAPKARSLGKLKAGENVIEMKGFPDAERYVVYLSSPGYATQWIPVKVEDGKVVSPDEKITMYKKRYVVLRYVFNRKGRSLKPGPGVESRRVTLEHWGQAGPMGEDWHVWQASQDAGGFGDRMTLTFHRIGPGFGFAEPPAGTKFEDMVEAPEDPGEYHTKTFDAEKGLVLYCRVNGNNPKDGQTGWGKISVEEVGVGEPKKK